MKKIFLLLLLLLRFLVSDDCYAQKWLWAKKIGLDPGGNDYGMAIAKDIDGNILVTGRVKGNSTFGSGANSVTLNTFGDRDIYISKYDSLGSFIWAKRYGGLYSDYGLGIKTDTNSNIYITGYFTDSAQFESTKIIGKGGQDIFLAKIDSSGNLIWVSSVGSTSNDYANSLEVDKFGNSYLVGAYTNTIVLGSDTLLNSGGLDFVLCKFDASGNCLWGKKSGNTLNDEGKAIVINDTEQSLYVCGYYNGNVAFGAISLSGYGGNDVFIAKYSSNGNCIWAKRAGSNNHELASAISLDKTDKIYVTGNYIAAMNFGTTSSPLIIPSTSGNQDVFIAKYDTLGNIIWAKKALGGSGVDNSQGISTNKYGNPVFCGFFESTCSFDGVSKTVEGGSRDVFVTEYNNSGSIVWLKTFKGITKNGIYASGHAVVTDYSDNTYLTGGFLDTVSFDGITLVSSGISSDVVTGKISPYLNASFYTPQTTVCLGDSVTFYSNSRGGAINYLWFWGGAINSSSTALNPIIVFDSIGTFDVQLIVSNGVESDTTYISNYINVIGCTVNADDSAILNNLDVIIYPNPSFGNFSILINNFVDQIHLSFNLFDVLGNKVFDYGDINKVKTDLSIEGLSRGIYTYTITSNTGILKYGKLLIN